MADGPLGWDAVAIGRRVRRGEASAREVVEAYLARAAEVQPRLAPFLEVLDPAARAAAAAVDRRVAAGGDPGPLAGVPLAVKDNLALAGRRLSCASRLLDGYVSPFTATAVERLAAAGAVVIGRTNLDEFAMGSSGETSAFGPSRHPADAERSPGGSSGGSAVAVAARAAALALGSDTGGSVRQPAGFCGLVGVKPTWGRVSRWGLVAFASSLDQVGPLAPTVREAALALGVMAGADPRDATSSPRPVDDYLAALERGPGLAGLRVAVPREVEETPLAPGVRDAWEAALARLTAGGADLVEVALPTLPFGVAAYAIVACAEASSNLARFDGMRYGRRAAAGEAFAERVAASRSEGFGAEVARRLLLGTFALSAGFADADYGRARAVAARLGGELEAALAVADVLAIPTTPATAFPFGGRAGDPLADYRFDAFTVPVNLAGLPAVALPAGEDGAGLPVSLQLVGRRFGEAPLLAAAHAFERAAPAAPRGR